MPAGQPLDGLDYYLREGEVVQIGMPLIGGGGHRDKTQLILAGGVACIGKLVRNDEDQRAARCERAAWLIARGLDWTDLVGAVALRRIEAADGDVVEAAVCVTWHMMGSNAQPSVADLPDEDVWRAAVFDALIEQTDRGGNNWGMAPDDDPCLRLYDHAYSFGHGNLQSSFYDHKEGDSLPDPVREALTKLADSWSSLNFDSLLPQEEVDRARQRLQTLVTSGVLRL